MNFFRGEMLSLARNLRGVEQKDIEKRSEILSQPKLSKYEQNLIKPKDRELKSLSRILDVPLNFFSLNISELRLDTPFFRKDRNTSFAMQEKAIAISKLQTYHLIKMNILEKINLEPDSNLPVKELAQKIREKLDINDTSPIDNLVSHIEKHLKIPIVFTPFDTNYVDALTIKSNCCAPVIFINDNFPDDRKNLSMAHELGHVLLHKASLSKTQILNSAKKDPQEDQAWDFAAELLMPEDGIKQSLEDAGTNLNNYIDLKIKWKVSMAALIFRARKLEAINNKQYQILWRKMSPYRKEEPIPLFEEQKPSRVREGIKTFIKTKQNIKSFLEELGINEDLYRLLYSKILPFEDLAHITT